MTAYLVVRAIVAEPADREPFNQWYRTEHLPDAIKAFGAVSAMRGWSALDPAVHTAFYRFNTLEDARAVRDGPGIRAMIAEFDRCWGSRVERTRDIIAIEDEMEGNGQ